MVCVGKNLEQLWYNDFVKVYLVKRIDGYWLGEFDIPVWWDRLYSIQPTVCIDLRGIERDVLVDYWNYLWRLGEYTFGALYASPGEPPRPHMDLERFAEYHVIKLWPERGRLWSAVGATGWGWGWRAVMPLVEQLFPSEVEGWKWDKTHKYWEATQMPTESKLLYPDDQPWPEEPTEVPSRTQLAIVPGWRYSFITFVWERIPYRVEVVKERPPKPGRRPGDFEPVAVSRVLKPYDIILRYQEDLWWAKSVFMAHENKWVFDKAFPIGAVLMFELRGHGVAGKNEDEWNFGMVWWERIMKRGKANWYLWATADVRYLGMGIHKSKTVYGLRPARA